MKYAGRKPRPVAERLGVLPYLDAGTASGTPVAGGAAPLSGQAPASASQAQTAGHEARTAPASGAMGFVFGKRRQFVWKSVLLLVATVALVPILLYKNAFAANLYLVALAVVHLAGLVIIAIGVQRHQIAPDKRGFAIRIIGLSILIGLLWLASKGLRTSTSEWIFWGSLFAIWALHTAGLALLHLKGQRENALCPFV